MTAARIEEFRARARANDEARFPRLREIKTHPALDYFPLPSEDEFARLLWSIRKIGLIHPIIEDETGTILDGRARALACEIAGVEPPLAAAKDPVAAYLFAANAARRHLNQGQRAIIAVMIENVFPPDDPVVNFIISKNICRRHLSASQLRVHDAMVDEPDYPESLVLPEARVVAQHRELARRVLQTAHYQLSDAYREALAREADDAKREEAAQRLAQLRSQSPSLAFQVDEGVLSLEQAVMKAEAVAAGPLLAEHINAIRTLGRRLIADTIEIGRRLKECRRLIRTGWIDWLDRELGLSDRGALDLIRVYELSVARSENFSDLNLPVSGLYLLARPSTPDKVRDDVLQRAADGEALTLSDIRRQVGVEKPAARLDASLRRIVAELAAGRPDDLLIQQLQHLVARIDAEGTSRGRGEAVSGTK